jgi:prepilin-type N-terminal cleavage/methylation domain-containing protein
MTMARVRRSDRGFSLMELMVATLLFTVIAGVVFSLLGLSMKRYQFEKDYLVAFQQASVAMDQITRDVHSTGYPPKNSFTTATATANPTKVANAFAFMPGYPAAPCTLGVCTTPGPYDLITEFDPGTGTIQWVRYQLVGTTLMRGVTPKVTGTDPVTATNAAGVMVAYLDNVMNNPSAAQMTALQASNPGLFPGNAAVPVFTYTPDPGTASQPQNIREVNVTLIVEDPRVDQVSKKLRIVTLTGQAARINPNK